MILNQSFFKAIPNNKYKMKLYVTVIEIISLKCKNLTPPEWNTYSSAHTVVQELLLIPLIFCSEISSK